MENAIYEVKVYTFNTELSISLDTEQSNIALKFCSNNLGSTESI